MAEFRTSLRKLDNLSAKLGSGVSCAINCEAISPSDSSFENLCLILNAKLHEVTTRMDEFQETPGRTAESRYTSHNNRIGLSIQCKRLMREVEDLYKNLSNAVGENPAEFDTFQQTSENLRRVRKTFKYLFHNDVIRTQCTSKFAAPLLNEFREVESSLMPKTNEENETDFGLYYEQAKNTHAKMDMSLDKIMSGCSRLKESALHIHDELTTQQSMLNEIDKKEDTIHGEMNVLNRRLQKILFDFSNEKLFLYLILFIALLTVVGYILYEVGAVKR
ncbi:syntaxin [Perkinsela sp. CCAP 1560/4]|nr:syntaxin [Perkinsela sp. CCAP 1560/4]KNH08344.1 syntaxin [Perkinsela sp. CCAP 1560/4]|eukprot:KNH05169.1 syntaxin [Perkinsela sp. CCAP 1560/4]